MWLKRILKDRGVPASEYSHLMDIASLRKVAFKHGVLLRLWKASAEEALEKDIENVERKIKAEQPRPEGKEAKAASAAEGKLPIRERLLQRKRLMKRKDNKYSNKHLDTLIRKLMKQ